LTLLIDFALRLSSSATAARKSGTAIPFVTVPIPRNQRQGIKAVGVSVGVETQSQEKVSPIISAAMILGGVGMMISGRPRA
jgi:hypothetical protein